MSIHKFTFGRKINLKLYCPLYAYEMEDFICEADTLEEAREAVNTAIKERIQELSKEYKEATSNKVEVAD
jgi:NDP-sugar pyrophosphorylase family protein